MAYLYVALSLISDDVVPRNEPLSFLSISVLVNPCVSSNPPGVLKGIISPCVIFGSGVLDGSAHLPRKARVQSSVRVKNFIKTSFLFDCWFKKQPLGATFPAMYYTNNSGGIWGGGWCLWTSRSRRNLRII